MIQRMKKKAHTNFSKHAPFTLVRRLDVDLTKDDAELFIGIFDDFAKSDDLEILSRDILETRVLRSSGTGIHFDEYSGERLNLLRMWIPLIYDLPLVVGDASSYWKEDQSLCNDGETLNHCAARHGFQTIKWVQQNESKVTDVIIFNLAKVPQLVLQIFPLETGLHLLLKFVSGKKEKTP